MFKKGDKVRHVGDKKEAIVTDPDMNLFLEVEYDGNIYYWRKVNVELVDDEDDWDADFGYWARNYSFEFMGGKNDEIKCICDSWTLFHFGCKCGAFEKEQNERERRTRGSDLDRKDEV